MDRKLTFRMLRMHNFASLHSRDLKMANKFVTVRMYNVGFGDAFLLLFPERSARRRVLIDCGMHSMVPGPRKMKEVVKQIVDDTTDGDGIAGSM